MYLFTFFNVAMYKTIQNQLKKKSVIKLLKLTIVNMAENCHQPASFGKEDMIFEYYFLGSLMSDVFFN